MMGAARDLIDRTWHSMRLRKAAFILGMLLLSFLVGRGPSILYVILIVGISGMLALLQWPVLGVLAIPVLALYAQMQVGTGTAVELNPATVMVPFMAMIWALDSLRSQDGYLAASPANKPLLLFLIAAMTSLLVGNALWDPAVPRTSNLVLVQLAQWAVFAFAALAFWLGANLVRSEVWLRRLVWCLAVACGVMAIIRVVPGGRDFTYSHFTFAVERAPFWALTIAIAASQLLFNRSLKPVAQVFLAGVCVSVIVYAFVFERATSSNWVGVGAVLGILAWLRFAKLRKVAIVLLVLLLISGGLTQSVYNFAGGEDEWEESGGSRLTLIGRVISVTMHNPITGLGPASYRAYANVEPLKYGQAYWVNPQINSHNNYVDLFAHTGLVGLILLGWFFLEAWRQAWALNARHRDGFLGAYVAGGLAVIASMGALMMFADWILPFVYNIGFSGFQASVLMWLYLGGVVAVANLPKDTARD